jgi:hypothetical protein
MARDGRGIAVIGYFRRDVTVQDGMTRSIEGYAATSRPTA